MPQFRVQRSIQVDAPPEKVFDTLADYRTWTTWSPWLCAEPDAEVNITEDAASVGSVYAWKGELVGQGEIEHRKLERGRLIEDEIRFVKPVRSTSQVNFEMQPAGEGTQLTWRMQGALPWFLFWMRGQMETFVGMDYERGLKMVKELIETGEVLSKTVVRGGETVGPLTMLGIRKQSSMSDIGPSMESAISEVCQKVSSGEIKPAGPVMTVYHKVDLKNQTFDYTSGIVVSDAESPPAGLSLWSISQTKALVVEHIGRYEHLANAWNAAYQHLRYKKLKASKLGSFEIYANDPEQTPPAELRTEIYLPLR